MLPTTGELLHNLYDVKERLDRIERDQRAILSALRSIHRTEANMAAKIDDLIKDVQDESTVIDGLGAFIQGLKDQLAQQGIDQAKLDQAFAVVEANKARLAAALTANTPAPPAP
jgi:uncharacterized protein YoxC